MSHFTKIQTQIRDLIHLKKAVEALGFTYIHNEGGTVEIKGWNNEKTSVLMEIKGIGPYSIGVVENKETGTLDFVSDWWGFETYNEINQESFLKKITQQYAYSSVIEKIQAKGFSVVDENIDEKKNIRVVLRRWN